MGVYFGWAFTISKLGGRWAANSGNTVSGVYRTLFGREYWRAFKNHQRRTTDDPNDQYNGLWKWKFGPRTILKLNKGKKYVTVLKIQEDIFVTHSGFRTPYYSNADAIVSPTKITNTYFSRSSKEKFWNLKFWILKGLIFVIYWLYKTHPH